MWLALAVACTGPDPADPHPGRVSDADGQLVGDAGEALGLAVAPLGDIDGDGVVDLGVAGLAGRVTVVRADWRGTEPSVAVVGGETPADSFGTAIAGDGAEWAVGAPTAGGIGTGGGAVYVFTGIPSGVGDARTTIRGVHPLDALGTSLRWLDLDDDGLQDLVIGAPGFDTLVAEAGAAYVFFGPVPSGDLVASDSVGELQGGLPIRHLGAPGDALAGSIGSTDADGDGVVDLVLSQGGTDADSGEVDAGAAFLFLGPLPRGTLSAPGLADTTFLGTRAGEYASEPVDGGGDLSGDGLQDLVLAANGAAPGRIGLFSGVRDGRWSLDDADLQLLAAHSGEGTGWALGAKGDVDGDGQPDLLVGSPYGGDGGEVRVVLGPVGVGTLELARLPVIRGVDGEELGKGIAVPGDLDHDGRDDFVLGGPLAGGGAGELARFGGY